MTLAKLFSGSAHSVIMRLYNGVFHARQLKFRLPKKVPLNDSHQHELMIVAIAKDEGLFLAEWVVFHLAVGATKILIYDNMSTDDSREVLKPFVEAGVVEVIPWPHFAEGLHTQGLAYSHALSYAGSSAKWMAFIDVDEFLFNPAGLSMPDILKRYEDLPALSIFRHHFGTSGHKVLPKGLVIDSFTKRMEQPKIPVRIRNLNLPKAVIQPAAVLGFIGAHRPLLAESNLWGYDEMRRAVRRNKTSISSDVLCINHYFTKDESTFRRRLERKTTAANHSFAPNWYHEDYQTVDGGDVTDERIQIWRSRTMEVMLRFSL
jgi:hypothetical protein